jgi:alpha-beta hydrolase superfamily lysophospholipase
MYITVGGIEQWIEIACESSEKPALLFLHGGPGASARRHTSGWKVWQKHFTVIQWDQRGAGLTFWRNGAQGSGRLTIEGMISDTIELIERLEQHLGQRKLILLGHSWGSFLAQMLVNDHPEAWDAVILSGSALRTPGSLNAAPLNARWAADDATGLEWLSRDPAVWTSFDEDPLTTDQPLLKLFGPVEAAKLYGRPRKDLGRDIPLLLLVGRDDPVGGPRSVHKLADEYRTRSGLTDITTLVYPDARHEIFNELQQDEVRADILSWLDTRIPPR